MSENNSKITNSDGLVTANPMAATEQELISRDNSILITVDNYAERTKDMKSLSQDWIPDERNLKANGMLAMELSVENNVAFGVLDHTSPRSEESVEQSLASAWHETKLSIDDPMRPCILDVQDKIGYTFANERLLQQALTRRAYAVENNDFGSGNYEILELVGDSIISTAVYKILLRQHGRFLSRGDAGLVFVTDYDNDIETGIESLNKDSDGYGNGSGRSRSRGEGTLSKIRQRLTDKAALGHRCEELGFDAYIRYGKDENRSSIDPKEDVMEAIVAAVTIDCAWDMDVIESVVDSLLDIHLTFDPWYPDEDAFDTLNSWHQKKYGSRPLYKVWKSDEKGTRGQELFECDMSIIDGREVKADPNLEEYEHFTRSHGVFNVSGKEAGEGEGIEKNTEEEFDTVIFHSRRDTKSEARSMAAQQGLWFVKRHGLFMNLKDVEFTPSLDEAVTQLEILSQRGYIGKVEYDIDDCEEYWECECKVDSFKDIADGNSKKEAKKKAAFGVLVNIMRSAGIDDEAWDRVLEE